jgi:hypothetical protein
MHLQLLERLTIHLKLVQNFQVHGFITHLELPFSPLELILPCSPLELILRSYLQLYHQLYLLLDQV